MTNATTRDAKTGWGIYLAANREITLDELNVRLESMGYGTISQRMLKHYQNLKRAGYTRYVSINRFDVSRASEPYENASANGRYFYRNVDLGVLVLFAKGSQLLEAYGRAIEAGDVGAILAFEDPEVALGLRKMKPHPSEMVTVRFLEAGRSISGRILEADLKGESCTIEIEYTRLVSIAAISDSSSLPTSDVRLVLVPADGSSEMTIDLAGKRLYNFFELLEGVRALANAAGEGQDYVAYAPPPLLDSLSIASPAIIVVSQADLVTSLCTLLFGSGILKAASALVEMRKSWHDGTDSKHKAELSRIEVELKEREVAKSQAEDGLVRDFRSAVRQMYPGSRLSDEDVDLIVRTHILPSVTSLAQSGIADISHGSNGNPEQRAS